MQPAASLHDAPRRPLIFLAPYRFDNEDHGRFRDSGPPRGSAFSRARNGAGPAMSVGRDKQVLRAATLHCGVDFRHEMGALRQRPPDTSAL